MDYDDRETGRRDEELIVPDSIRNFVQVTPVPRSSQSLWSYHFPPFLTLRSTSTSPSLTLLPPLLLRTGSLQAH